MPFQPGQSGNPGGRPKDKPFKTALMMELKAAENGEECVAPRGSLRWNARKLIEAGELQSIKEMADRLDGKPAQAIVGDDTEAPIGLALRWLTAADTQKSPSPTSQDQTSAPSTTEGNAGPQS